MNILVTDGNSRAALAITRSLGAKGHAVFVGDKRPLSLASCSKYCREAVVYPDPKEDSDRFVDALTAIGKRYSIDLIIPVTDICVLPVAEHRQRFGHKARIPLAKSKALKLAASKDRLMDIAVSLGVAIPRSLTVADKNASFDAGQFTFPIVIKPSRSKVPTDTGWLLTSVDYASSTNDLKARLNALHPLVFPVLLQERIIGPGMGMFYCYNKGKCIASFAHKRLREKPPSGGVSVLRESVAPHPQADRFGRTLLDHLDWHGVAMVEFKLDERDQTPKLMEINGRFWGSLQLAIDAGVDFPELLAAISINGTVTPVDSYQLGVRSRWLWGELDLLLMYLSKSAGELKLPQGHPSRLRSTLQILNPFYRNQHFEVLRLTDMRPWFQESANWFKRQCD